MAEIKVLVWNQASMPLALSMRQFKNYTSQLSINFLIANIDTINNCAKFWNQQKWKSELEFKQM